MRERNEALDCRVYARAALWIAGADRWPEALWAAQEAQLCVATGTTPTAPSQPGRRRAGTGEQGNQRADWIGRRGEWR